MPHPTGPLKELARSLGFENTGVCLAQRPPHFDAYNGWLEKGYQGQMGYLRRHLPLKAHPERLLPGVRSVVAVALNYCQPNPRREGFPHIARYALGRDYHRVMRGKLRRLARWIESEFDGAETRACVDSAPMMERDFAHLAGLGWFGKNTMLIDSRRGSWFFIGLLLTTVEFVPDAPSFGSCGTCRKCVDACPTAAIVFEDNRWQVDARKCVSYLTIEHRGEIPLEMKGGIGHWTFGCDVCQEVCPFNARRQSQPGRAQETNEDDFLQPRPWPSLEDLQEVSAEDFDTLTKGSPVRRAGLQGIQRNARTNLENARARPRKTRN